MSEFGDKVRAERAAAKEARAKLRAERREKFPEMAEQLAKGEPIYQVMKKYGYSDGVAKLGVRGIPKGLLKHMKLKGYKVAELGNALRKHPDLLGDIAVGRLALNAMDGKDGGVMSAKTLGSHRDLNLWVPESQAGVIVLNVPTALQGKLEELAKPVEPLTLEAK